MVNVKANFKNMYHENLSCNYCNENDIQTQEHLLICPKIIDKCPEVFDNIEIEHDDIYGSIKQQLAVTKLYQNILDTIEAIKLEEDEEEESTN